MISDGIHIFKKSVLIIIIQILINRTIIILKITILKLNNQN